MIFSLFTYLFPLCLLHFKTQRKSLMPIFVVLFLQKLHKFMCKMCCNHDRLVHSFFYYPTVMNPFFLLLLLKKKGSHWKHISMCNLPRKVNYRNVLIFLLISCTHCELNHFQLSPGVHSAHTHTRGQCKKFSGSPKLSLRPHCNPKISAHFSYLETVAKWPGGRGHRGHGSSSDVRRWGRLVT